MKAIIHVKTDRKVKENAKKVADELGLSLSAVINASLRQLIRSGEIYFSTAPRMTPELEHTLGFVEKDIKTKRNLSQVFSSAREMDDHLDSL